MAREAEQGRGLELFEKVCSLDTENVLGNVLFQISANGNGYLP
jgi:hypothetical protein